MPPVAVLQREQHSLSVASRARAGNGTLVHARPGPGPPSSRLLTISRRPNRASSYTSGSGLPTALIRTPPRRSPRRRRPVRARSPARAPRGGPARPRPGPPGPGPPAAPSARGLPFNVCAVRPSVPAARQLRWPRTRPKADTHVYKDDGIRRLLNSAGAIGCRTGRRNATSSALAPQAIKPSAPSPSITRFGEVPRAQAKQIANSDANEQ